MDLGRILLGLVGLGLLNLVAYTLMRMSGDQDRAARHEEEQLYPYCDDAKTQPSIV